MTRRVQTSIQPFGQRFKRALVGTLRALTLLLPVSILAQEEAAPREVQIPNPMALHTWFIIVAVGAFLAWCISYVLDRQRESSSPKPQREVLLRQKNQLLDRIADLESKKEAGALPQNRYEKEYRKARGLLSEVVSRLNQSAGD